MRSMLSTVWLRGIIYSLPLVSLAILLILWNVTSPVDVGPAGIFAIFVLLYFFWLGVVFSVLRAGVFIVKKLYKKNNDARHFNAKRVYYIATIIAFIPVLMLALQSVGQLEISDLALVTIFASLAIFYVIKRS